MALQKEQFLQVLEVLNRLKKNIATGKVRPSDIVFYRSEIEKYTLMRDGGDGGNFRDTNNTIRELHFSNWRDSDFQLLLEELGEAPVMTDDEWREKFDHEVGFFGRLFKKGGRRSE
tara:strand:+ start:949 stop:1296 length:348 start_codon:yes stop_codon:yes gene_type:complete